MARETHRSILEATLALLEQGDGAFSYERLAKAAGVARQTLYAHFPDRADLLIAAVDHRRGELGAEDLRAPILEAATARDALRALVDYHVAFTPQIMTPARAVEAQRAVDPELSAAFERRSSGRRQTVRHVMTRLRAEGDLRPTWSVDDATDLVSALMTASFTSDLLDERDWTTDQLRARLLDTIEQTLLVPDSSELRSPTQSEGEAVR